MLLARNTLYRDDYDYDYLTSGGEEFVCAEALWEFFPLSGPAPETIRIDVHDRPAMDRVKVSRVKLYPGVFVFDGDEHATYSAASRWLCQLLSVRDAIYVEIWY